MADRHEVAYRERRRRLSIRGDQRHLNVRASFMEEPRQELRLRAEHTKDAEERSRRSTPVLNATRIGRRDSMRKFEESRKVCTPVAQTPDEQIEVEGTNEGHDDSEVPMPSGLINGGVDEARSRDLRRDRQKSVRVKLFELLEFYG